MASQESVVQRINTELEEDWEAKLNHDGRIYYVSHKQQTTSWLPPRENWTDTSGLPYGWETGLDKNDKNYFINHVERYTTRDDPRQDADYVEPPRPREVELVRDLEKGFGFVAGSEKPVVVRFVTEGGPSEDKLLPGDQILKINGEEVRRAPREKVIELVRSCKEAITLTVCQPYTDNSSRKSALLTAAKKAKLKTNPSRVRFADAVMVNGASITNPSPIESYVPFMPNVLKVFLENGQTKSFKYDNKTTVRDVVVSLQEKLNVQCVHHFSLVLQNMKNHTGTAAKMTLLQEHETLAEIASRQGARYFRCLFRVTFVPKDAYDLLKEDPIAFEYFYLQCCNDVIQERFASEMKYDTALRLAALHIQQHAMTNNMAPKISIKAVVKDCGLDKFVSRSLLESMKGKDLKRMLSQYLKMNQNLAAPGQKQLTALQAKLHYMKIVSELKTFGSRVFMVTLLDKKTEAMLLVGPHSGVSIVTNIKSYALTQLSDFQQLEQVKVTKDGDNMHRVDLMLKAPLTDVISLGLLSEDAQNFVCLVAGYYAIFVDPDRRLVERTMGKNTSDPDVPSYGNVHRVQAAPWSYPEDLVSEIVSSADDATSDNQRLVDLTHDPPEYVEDEEYLSRVKQDLGIKTGEVAVTSVADTPTNIALVSVVDLPPSPLYITKANNVNGTGASPYEEGVTSFGTSSSDSSSLNSSFSSQNTAHLPPASSALPPAHLSTIDLRKTITAANGHSLVHPSNMSLIQDNRTDSERSSDTDSLSAGDTERRPSMLLVESLMQNGEARQGGDGESDDTDSVGGTPRDSPGKGRTNIARVPSVESGMHSFGLHSPDMVPPADVDFHSLGQADVHRLPSDVKTDPYSHDPASIPNKKLYFDPDIIDLTIFPMLDSTAEDESVIDFTTLSSLPPPSFATSPPPSSSSPSDTSRFIGSMDVANLSSHFSNGYHGGARVAGQTGLMRSVSAGHCPDFFDSDIDSLIAQYYVPPPPSSFSDSQPQEMSKSFSGAISSHHSSMQSDTVPTDDDFTSLIIPPPPSLPTTQKELAPSSPEASNTDTARKETAITDTRRRIHHKRSSSVDVGALRLAQQHLQDLNKSRSMDIQNPGTQEGGHQLSLPLEDKSVDGFDSDSHEHLAADSPATVSLKLHSLLKSLPTLVPEADQQNLHRTGSLRIPRSASWDVLSLPSADGRQGGHSKVLPEENGCGARRTLFSGTASLGRTTGKRLATQEQSSSIAPSGDQTETSPPLSPLESFASLKAKLKDYRDHLLKRASHSRKNSADSEVGEKKGSLRRSNSSSRLFSQLSGGRKTKESNSVLGAAVDGSLKQRAARESSSTGDLQTVFAPQVRVDGEDEKRSGTPVVLETLAVTRNTLRPVASSVISQNKSKKSGPMKALSNVFTSEEKASDSGFGDTLHDTSPSPSKPASALVTSKKHTAVYGSKDDLSVPSQGEHKKKGKVKANPYATVKMWRPITMSCSVSHNEDAFRNFSNFDVLVADAKLPATGDLRNEDCVSTADASTRRVTQGADRPHDPNSATSSASSLPASDSSGARTVQNSAASKRAAADSCKVKRAESQSKPSSAVTIPLKSRTLSVEQQREQQTILVPPPRRSRQTSKSTNDIYTSISVKEGVDVPVDYTPGSSPSSQRSRSLPRDNQRQGKSPERRGRSIMDSSYDVISLDVSKSIKNVLSRTYGPESFDEAGRDVETMLARLKMTMDTLKTAQAVVSGSQSQFQTVRQELQLQTKKFVLDAKMLVAGATGERQTICHHLHNAMHTLARLLLHSQAAMVRMHSIHQAQHVGFEVLKVSASFKGTVAAANAAVGRPTTDPHMKYLMRQATNLAGLLSTLLKTLKNLEQS